ncbi:DNA ligase 1 [Pancytospora philotis]|nr:DNA ligase 1 [Pancytospora philotis]
MGERTTFLELCNVLEGISKTTKRLEIQAMLSKFLSLLAIDDPESLAAALFLCTATIYPQHFGTELGIGDRAIFSAVSSATGLSAEKVQQLFRSAGDLGDVAMKHRVTQLFVTERRLTIVDALRQLRLIAKENGKNSVNAKKNIMLQLINVCSPLETKYMVRLFTCKLKIGLALQTVLIALACALNSPVRLDDEAAAACDVSENACENVSEDVSEDTSEAEEQPKRQKQGARYCDTTTEAVTVIKEAYNKQPDFEVLVQLALEHGISNLPAVCKITPGIPLKPMLAQPSKNLTKAFSRVENIKFVSEFKYDGERVQLHHKDGLFKVFSRNSEDISAKYPDLTSLSLSSKSYIIDGEVVAYKDGEIQPFQVLSTRKRKNTETIEVQVCVFAFDLIYFDGEELLEKPLEARRKALYANISEIEGKFRFADSIECRSVEDIDAHFRASVQSSCEGVMLKSLESVYKPSMRTNSWVKMKSDYLDNLGDSMDLVVMGVFYGKGKRTGAYGGFLLGVYNDTIDKFEACCKIGTGFSDAALAQLHGQLAPTVTVNAAEYVYKSGAAPDHWVEPKYVWEVKAASLSLSPVYPAGSVDGKGISLRFPRFVRQRDDKGVREATTSNQILRMYVDNRDEESGDEFN